MTAGWDVWFGIPSQWIAVRGHRNRARGHAHRRPRRQHAPLRPPPISDVSDMSEMNGAAVVVVGGGVTGLSAAWWLARSGARRPGARQGGRRLGGVGPQRRRRLALSQPAVPRGAAALAADGRAARLFDRVSARAGDLRPDRSPAGPLPRHGRRCAGALGYRVGRSGPGTGARGSCRWPATTLSAASTCHFGGHANPQRTVQAYAWALQDLGGRIAAAHAGDADHGRGRARGRGGDPARTLRLRQPGRRRRDRRAGCCLRRSGSPAAGARRGRR